MNSTTRLLALSAAMTLAGCSTIDPYQRSAGIDGDLVALKAVPLAGGLGDALVEVNGQRLEWFGTLSAHARVSNLSSLAVYGLTAWGLYQGLKPGFVSDGVASESTRRNLAKAGIGAGLGYSVGNLFLNDKHDEVYVEGFKTLTCLMARTRPYLLTQGQLDDLARQADDLEQLVGQVDVETLHVNWVDGVRPNSRPQASTSSFALSRTIQALKQSRQTLERARMLVSRVETAGFQLRRQNDLVVASVSEELRRHNKGIAKPDEFLASLQAITGRFQAIAPVDTDDHDEPDGESKDKPKSGDADESASKAAAAAATPTEKAASSAASTEKALETLQKTVEQLRAIVIEPALKKDEAYQVLKKRTEVLETHLKKAEAEIKQLAKPAVPATVASATVGADALGRLAMSTAWLYAQRRKVNQYLINHNDLASRVKSIPECRAGGRSTMVLMPAEDKTVSPGSYRFMVSGVKGVPVVSLDGNAGAAPEGRKTLSVSIEGGMIAIDVLITDKASGALRLLVHDPATRALEDVVMTVVPKKP